MAERTTRGDSMRILRTQISGRYNFDNLSLFDFKARVESAGVCVTFPVGNAILKHEYGFASTVAGEGDTPYWLTEANFLQDILECDLQITFNLRDNDPGYVGESTAVETAYALALGKPTVLVRPISSFSPSTSPVVRDFLERHEEFVPVAPLDVLEPGELSRTLLGLVGQGRHLMVGPDERIAIEREAFTLVGSYHHTWLRKLRDEAA